jgi:hypothetical protein
MQTVIIDGYHKMEDVYKKCAARPMAQTIGIKKVKTEN